MDKEFINYLPSEIVIDILSRLPIRSVIICKCVCKSWLNLLGTHEFAKFHLSQSAPGLVFSRIKNTGSYKIFEFNDDLDLELHELHYRLFTKFIFPYNSVLQGSTNGLLLFRCRNYEDDELYICNPITRDYVKLHYPKDFVHFRGFHAATYGFGASKMSGQHKVVRIFHGYMHYNSVRRLGGATKSECHVYTLGTRSWRSIAASSGDPLDYGGNTSGAFVNGNLHWLVYDVNGSQLISCFDLETEVFSTFPCPGFGGRLCVLGNCLCFCESSGDGMIIWLAKEYGVEKCWTKEFVTSSICIFNAAHCKLFHPIKLFRDGDILIAPFMFCYSTKTRAAQEIGIFDQFKGEAIIYTPSFLSLKSFGIETAISF